MNENETREEVLGIRGLLTAACARPREETREPRCSASLLIKPEKRSFVFFFTHFFQGKVQKVRYSWIYFWTIGILFSA